MSATEAAARIARQDISSMCRDGHCDTCKRLKMRCLHSCHGAGGQAQPTVERVTPTKAPTRAKTQRRAVKPVADLSFPASEDPLVLPDDPETPATQGEPAATVEDGCLPTEGNSGGETAAEPVETGPDPEPTGVNRATAKRKPVVERIRNCKPPAHSRKQYYKPLHEQVRPLLEEILVDADREWNRVILCFTTRQAGRNVKKLRETYSRSEWEWDFAELPECSQSAIYVRWIGKEGNLL